MTDKTIDNNSIIISLNVDALLFDKLEEITKAGFSVVEINSSEPTLLKKIINDFPQLKIGVSNIINPQQLEDCCKASVHFATSPGFLATLVQTAEIYSIKYIPSITTISEGMQALAINCHNVKVFPSDLKLCEILSKNLPLLRLFPAEIKLEEAKKYLNLSAVAAVGIFDPDLKQLRKLNEELISA